MDLYNEMKIKSVGEDVEKPETLYLLVKKQNGIAAEENSLVVSQNVKNKITKIQNLLLGTYPK